ncbi:hypothetical protein JCM10908_001019 [Rhodotorula pacifica]|uniref:prephenate dehydratase PHA2 n=1 Tax=Rhodotorula pacifica TaxID=1495444 RepID=UPI00317C0E75
MASAVASTSTSSGGANGLQKPRVAFLGPLGTYSHQAATDFFGECECVPQERIADVFTAVSSSRAIYGVVPIENSSFGPVAETAEQLRTSELALRGMTALRIGHALLASKEAGNAAPRRVYSHEQALGQCRRYLAKRYPNAEIVQVNSTAKAAQEAARDPEGMAVCSFKCAEVYDLRVVDRDIQDAGDTNTTRFVVLSLSSTTLPPSYPIMREHAHPAVEDPSC